MNKKYGGIYTFRKYSNKQKYVKALHKVAYKLWREACFKLYGKYCYVQKYYPYIKITHTDTIQVDHCISRGDKNFFYSVENGLPVCSGCNQAKHYKAKGIDEAITEMVKKRNKNWYEKALWLHRSGTPNTNFSQTWYLEEIIDKLKEVLK